MTAIFNKIFCIEREGDVLIVCPQGDALGFRYNDVHQESNTTLQTLSDPSLKHLVIDFASKQMLGSVMISVIIKLCRSVGTKGGRAAFCNASPDMLDVLNTMNLTKLWKHYPNRADALAAVRGS
jgi:anti-anti-sigma regulatory factor